MTVKAIDTEHIILHGLLRDPEFSSKTLDSISQDFFKNEVAKSTFSEIQEYFLRHSKTPTSDEMNVLIQTMNVPDEVKEEALDYLEPLGDISTEFMLEESEKYCKERAVMNALFAALEIADDPKKSFDPIPELMSSAINFSFDLNIGLNYYDDIDKRIDSYSEKTHKIPSKLAMINRITNGGYEAGTLNVETAPTGFGKTIRMADEAKFQSEQGLNVVYYTFEMSDLRIARRLDANYLDMPLNEVPKFAKNLDNLRKRFGKQRESAKGELIFKDFAPDTTTAMHLSNHIRQVQVKLGKKIDIVFIDYINLMTAAGVPKNSGTYKIIETICKEIIAHISKKYGIPVISATQLQRGSQGSSDVSIANISESQGLSNTVDFLIAWYSNDDLMKNGWARGKQLKNRYGDLDYYNAFIVGMNRAKMKFYDVEESKSNELLENLIRDSSEKKKDSPLMDESPGGGIDKSPARPKFANFGI